jgi:hypothetical protein
MHMKSNRRAALLCMTFALVTLVGCSSDLPATIPVEGTVTFEGRDDMPTNPVLFFRMSEAAPGYPLRPARGVVDADGELEVTAFERGDGLVPGKYDVMIEFFDLKPGGNPDSEDGYQRTEFALELSYTIPAK